MKHFTILIHGILIITFLGCSQKIAGLQPYYITNAVETRLMPLIEQESQIIKQHVTSWHDTSENTFIGILKLSSKEIVSIAMADFGRLFTLTYTKKGITGEVSPFLSHNKFVPEYIFNDIQFIYYPIDTLTLLLPENITVQESMEADCKIRLFFYEVDNFAKVTYYPDRSIKFVNFERKYTYTIVIIE